MKVFLYLVLAALIAPGAWAGRLDTVQVQSAAMDTLLTAVVAVPDAAGPHPVVYLLHGYSGGAFDWARNTDLRPLADRFGVVIVCPDGSPDSWYLDSPQRPRSLYETFVARELPAWIEAHYSVITEKHGRAITGLSMGGHGALFLALRHPETFGAAASMSGGLDLRYDTTRWHIAQHLGPYSARPDRWADHSVSALLLRASPDHIPPLLIDCGVDDFFLPDNRMVHQILMARKIPHDYVERPGGHTWSYWVRVLPYHLQFFREQFERED